MQLSWIDPDSLRALAEKLQDPLPPPRIENLDDQAAAFDKGLARALEADLLGLRPGEPASLPPEPPDAPSDEAAAPPSDTQVSRIREQLQVIRQKAALAGLLPVEPPTVLSSAPKEEAPAETFAPAPPAAAISRQALFASIPRPVTPSQATPTATEVAHRDSPASFLPLEGTLGDRLESYGRWASARVSAREMLLVDDHGDVLWGSSSRSDLALSALLSMNAAMRSSAGGVCRPPAVIHTHLSPDRELTLLPCATRHGTVTLAMLAAEALPEDLLSLLREGLILAIEGPSRS